MTGLRDPNSGDDRMMSRTKLRREGTEGRPLLSRGKKIVCSVKHCVRRESTTYIQRVLGVAYHRCGLYDRSRGTPTAELLRRGCRGTAFRSGRGAAFHFWTVAVAADQQSRT